MDHPTYNPLLHRAAQLTTAATLVLIFMGGLVTSHKAGMSVPDWPNSYGYNMFTFPISKWVGGIFYEHTHRLMGTVVGFLSIILMCQAWGFGEKENVRRRLKMVTVGLLLAGVLCLLFSIYMPRSTSTGMAMSQAAVHTGILCLGLMLGFGCALFSRRPDERRWVRWLSVGVLGAVVAQGILGGLRVELVALGLAPVHAIVAQVCLCIMALACVVTSRWWMNGYREHPDAGRGLVPLLTACVIAIFAQLVVGALMRHYDAGLAIPDLPLHYGNYLPPTDAASLQAANESRLALPRPLPPVTLGQVWLHAGHRIGAVVVSVLLILAIVRIMWRRPRALRLRRPAMLLGVLLATQLTLGVLTVLWEKPADVASLHVAVGALTLMTTFVLLVRAIRLYSPLWRAPSSYLEIRVTSNRATVTA